MSVAKTSFEDVVNANYQNLYRFAVTLTHSEADASDLTQSAFERLLRKPEQLRDATKVKTWLFTTLYRLFLQQQRHSTRFPHVPADGIEFPSNDSAKVETQTDADAVIAALKTIEEPFRSVLVLFYLEEHSYREIAEILDIPIGTVMSRISRGKTLLRELLDHPPGKIVPLPLKEAS